MAEQQAFNTPEEDIVAPGLTANVPGKWHRDGLRAPNLKAPEKPTDDTDTDEPDTGGQAALHVGELPTQWAANLAINDKPEYGGETR